MSKRLITITALCLSALATWVAAPALSLTPYVPDPVEFSQPLPAMQPVGELSPGSALRAAAATLPTNSDVSADGPVSWISPPIAAPKPFDAVGVRHDRREIEYRTKRADEPWSNWVEAGNGDPVLTGHSTEVQVRTRGFKPSGSLFYVNVTGTDSPAHHLLSAARGAIHGAFVSVAATPLASAASTSGGTGTQTVTTPVPGSGSDPGSSNGPKKPAIVSRKGWDPNNKCKPRRKASLGKVKAGVVHHTVNTNTYKPSAEKGLVLAICKFHRDGNGWDDIGYNALSSRSGKIYEGRAGGLTKAVIGAHAQGFNNQTTSVSSIGDHRSVKIGSAELNAIEDYLAWKLITVHHLDPNSQTTLTSGGGSLNRWPKGAKVKVYRVTFHSKLGNTECPGPAGRHQVTAIRKATAKRG
ncbi:MAG: hypothetical protein QOG09_1849 [Solirubrobacterales bacterium]|nr:hypothetical protein [Solirubrobacterales bacterium]